jgi:hypothetical protein
MHPAPGADTLYQGRTSRMVAGWPAGVDCPNKLRWAMVDVIAIGTAFRNRFACRVDEFLKMKVVISKSRGGMYEQLLPRLSTYNLQ